MFLNYSIFHELASGSIIEASIAKVVAQALGYSDRHARSIAKKKRTLDTKQQEQLMAWTWKEIDDQARAAFQADIDSTEGRHPEDWWQWKFFTARMKAISPYMLGMECGSYTEETLFRFLNMAADPCGVGANDPLSILQSCVTRSELSEFIEVSGEPAQTSATSAKTLLFEMLCRELLYVLAAFEAELIHRSSPRKGRHSRIVSAVLPAIRAGKSPQSGWLDLIASARGLMGTRGLASAMSLRTYGVDTPGAAESFRSLANKWRRGTHRGKPVLISWEYCNHILNRVIDPMLRKLLAEEHPQMEPNEVTEEVTIATNFARAHFAIIRLMTAIHNCFNLQLRQDLTRISATFDKYAIWYSYHLETLERRGGHPAGAPLSGDSC